MLDHPNIIKYYETFIYNHKLCIIMEYADNGKKLYALNFKGDLKEKVKQAKQ